MLWAIKTVYSSVRALEVRRSYLSTLCYITIASLHHCLEVNRNKFCTRFLISSFLWKCYSNIDKHNYLTLVSDILWSIFIPSFSSIPCWYFWSRFLKSFLFFDRKMKFQLILCVTALLIAFAAARSLEGMVTSIGIDNRFRICLKHVFGLN